MLVTTFNSGSKGYHKIWHNTRSCPHVVSPPVLAWVIAYCERPLVLEGSNAKHVGAIVAGATTMVVASTSSGDLVRCIRHQPGALVVLAPSLVVHSHKKIIFKKISAKFKKFVQI